MLIKYEAKINTYHKRDKEIDLNFYKKNLVKGALCLVRLVKN